MDRVYKTDTGWLIGKFHKKLFTRVKVKAPDMPQGKIKKERRWFCHDLDLLAIELNNNERLADDFDFNMRLEGIIEEYGLGMILESWYRSIYSHGTVKRAFLNRTIRFAEYGLQDTALFSWFPMLASEIMSNKEMKLRERRATFKHVGIIVCDKGAAGRSGIYGFTSRRGGTKDLVNTLLAIFGSRNVYGVCYGHVQ